ncbi:hypothetical protein [Sphingomonas sanxanigenens]|uniref:DUF429 domain-containing protein n=1 Tax=Sphingomonas sanxanigenens DSM 19645 = NX02 TaxID=1123269 RepID=W0A7M0_9SPHN|nr:hypothetical protein [Sphingomonas sanxanigenens]AHE52333.1 hypothetical protein NX02_02875 [Sphingomonas sanxanigenens DSM 19645 = NX02]
MHAPFTRFAVADWSGAKGSSHKGIALALCEAGRAAPVLVPPPGRAWSREGIAEWVEAQADTRLLIGFDFSFAPPLVERGAYLPGEGADVPSAAKRFWAYVAACCADSDPDLGAASFLERTHRRHFYFGAADGRKADYMHLRRCEAHYNAGGGGKPSTVYDAIGAAQVAKASFAGMRLLDRLSRRVPVWPFDPVPAEGALVVEIYTAIAARAAGLRKGLSKLRDGAALDAGLAALGSEPHVPLARYDDHATDAILTAAWLRACAARADLWHPRALTPQIAETEGWTFGVV